MHKKIYPEKNVKSLYFMSWSLWIGLSILMTVLTYEVNCEEQNLQLPTKIINIKKSDEEIPIIILSELSSQFQSISLILDSGSEQLALFDNQCYSCINTFSVCPHIKTFNNQTLITYLLTKFKGDFSYLTLAAELRIRFFCVIQADKNFNSIQTNGILGIKSTLIKLKDQKFKSGNGIKIWRKIIQKVYNSEINQLKQKGNDFKKFKRVEYSIFYSQYHTQLILGRIPNYFRQNLLVSYYLNEEIYAKKLFFFSAKSYDEKDDKILNKQYQVHLDTGSSVIVLPWDIFKHLFEDLTQKVSKQCSIVQSMIKCPKISINKLIQSDFKFRISLRQKSNSQQTEFQINLQNLIQNKIGVKDNTFSFKVYGHQNQKENQQQLIILGVPFFKQYLIQFDIPFEEDEKIPFIHDMKNDRNKENYLQQKEQYIKIYGHQIRLKQQVLSPYQHLIKNQAKNIKILLLTYLVLVIAFSYVFIKMYWFFHQFFHGKKSIV